MRGSRKSVSPDLRRLLVAGAAAGALVVLAWDPAAAPSRPTPRPAGASAPPKAAGATRARGSLDRLAARFASRLAARLRRARGGTLLVQIGQPAGVYDTGRAKLARALRGLIDARLAALGAPRIEHAPAGVPPPTVVAQGRKSGADHVLIVRILESDGQLHLRGRLYRTRQTMWGRLLSAKPRLVHHLHAATPLDTEVRSYLGRRPAAAVTCHGRWYGFNRRPIWGLELGDVDGDARQELVVLQEEWLMVRRWSPVFRKLERVIAAQFKSPLAKVRPRFPLASLAIADVDGDRREDILARVSPRAEGIQLSYKNRTYTRAGKIDGYPLGVLRKGKRWHVAVGTAAPGRPEFRARSFTWRPTWRTIPLPRAFASLRIERTRPASDEGGTPAPQLLGAVDLRGNLQLTSLPSGKAVETIRGVGVAFAIGDLTGDGKAEVVTTAAKPFGTRDHLAVRQPGKVRPLCRVRGFEGSVTALAVGDVNHDGHAEIVAAVWLARRRRSFILILR